MARPRLLTDEERKQNKVESQKKYRDSENGKQKSKEQKIKYYDEHPDYDKEYNNGNFDPNDSDIRK